MKRFLFLVALVLLASFVSAAEVDIGSSGYTRGSLEYSFTYDPADTEPVLIKDVLPNDVITIFSAGNPDRTYYFQSLYGEKWNYQIIKGEKGLSISLHESVAVDLDNDNVSELYMELSDLNGKKGTFTFIHPTIIPAVTPPVEPEVPTESEVPPTEIPVEPGTPIQPVQPSLPTPPTVQPSSAPFPLIGYFVIAIVVLTLIIGTLFYFWSRDDPDVPEPKGHHHEKHEEKHTAEKKEHKEEIKEKKEETKHEEKKSEEKSRKEDDELEEKRDPLPSLIMGGSRVRRR